MPPSESRSSSVTNADLDDDLRDQRHVRSRTRKTTSDDLVSMRYVDGWYEMREDGYSMPEPVLYLLARDENYRQRIVEIDGFHPYFCVEISECLDKEDALDNDHRVRRVETVEDDGSAITSLHGDRLAKIYTVKPYHVAQLRENFEDTWEADILFPDRFAYDVGIVDGFAVPELTLSSDGPMSHEGIVTEGVDCSVPPRIAYLDIEVQQTEDGPSVVSERGKELADNPITAVTVYDSYTRSYTAFVLAHEQWDSDDYADARKASANRDQSETAHDYEAAQRPSSDSVDVQIYETEHELLAALSAHMSDYRYDVWTAWNADFDFPYLINRYFALDHQDVYQLSPVYSVDELDGSGRFMNGDIDGVLLFDLLKGYEKSQIHELEDSSLSTVAAAETDIEKMDVDEQTAWVEDPESFVAYNIVDVRAMVEIDDTRGVLA